MENLVQNGGFEDDLKGWAVANVDKAQEEGWKVEASAEAGIGTRAIHIAVEPKARNKSRNAYQSLGSLFPAHKLLPGQSYLVSCRMKASGVNTQGGEYCGAGASLSIWSAGYKDTSSVWAFSGDTAGKWIKVISKPLLCPEGGAGAQVVAAISYTAGEAWIDDIVVSEAYADMSVSVHGSGILQVLVADENGRIIDDSGRLSTGAKDYSKSLKVISAYRYTVKVVDKDGNIYQKDYPLPVEK